jgi:hypothetical protein
MDIDANTLAACHHCGGAFGENETRIVADVLVSGASAPERIAIHEDCIPDDKFLRYPWENMMVERMKAKA